MNVDVDAIKLKLATIAAANNSGRTGQVAQEIDDLLRLLTDRNSRSDHAEVVSKEEYDRLAGITDDYNLDAEKLRSELAEVKSALAKTRSERDAAKRRAETFAEHIALDRSPWKQVADNLEDELKQSRVHHRTEAEQLRSANRTLRAVAKARKRMLQRLLTQQGPIMQFGERYLFVPFVRFNAFLESEVKPRNVESGDYDHLLNAAYHTLKNDTTLLTKWFSIDPTDLLEFELVKPASTEFRYTVGIRLLFKNEMPVSCEYRSKEIERLKHTIEHASMCVEALTEQMQGAPPYASVSIETLDAVKLERNLLLRERNELKGALEVVEKVVRQRVQWQVDRADRRLQSLKQELEELRGKDTEANGSGQS